MTLCRADTGVRPYEDDVAKELKIQIAEGRTVGAIRYPAAGAAAGVRLVLAPGAGQPQTSRFMVETATALTEAGLEVVTFNFPYMEAGRSAPDKAPVLEACYRRILEAVAPADDPHRLFIGGKSMGGRMASQYAASGELGRHAPVRGLVFLGYPLHPPGRPEKERRAHLPRVPAPMLFVQGGRDTFGTPAELAPILRGLPNARLIVVERGDHSLTVSRNAEKQQASDAAWRQAIVDWIAAGA